MSELQSLGRLRLEEHTSPSLAELAGCGPCNDWSSLPHSLLADVFRRLLEQHHSVEDIVRTWQGLALVCKGWLAALREATALCLELTKPQHLGPAAQRWLSRVPLEVLAFARSLQTQGSDEDAKLLARAELQARSASVLRSIMHIGSAFLPLMPSFPRLKQLAIFCRDGPNRAATIDVAAFHHLPKLSCLTIAGWWGDLDTRSLPSRLKHLAISLHGQGQQLTVALPDGMRHLEMLSARADTVVVDWPDVCARCEEVHLAAGLLALEVSREPFDAIARRVGIGGLQDHLYRRVAAALVGGERLVEATLSFFDLALQSGPRRRLDGPAVPAEPDDFLQTLRDALLPEGVDVNPALEVCPDFVRDVPSPEACFVLELVKQPAGKPKSMHFTTPVTDAEARLLTSQPVWRISWCDDPRAPQILADPQFRALSADTLTDLLSIPLVPELDLRPFTKLLSVLGHVGDADLAPTLRRLPRSLESLCLTAEGVPNPPDFEAGVVRHLRRLKELSLYGHRRHDLSRLQRRVKVLRVLNPACAEGEAIGSGPNYTWPPHLRRSLKPGRRQAGDVDGGGGSGSDDESDSGSEASGASGASGESFSSATSGPAAAPADAGPAGAPHRASAAAEEAQPAAAVEDDAASSADSEDFVDAEHGHRHRHGDDAEDERHSEQGCTDPYCPLHSGKSFLQVSLTDHRQQSAVDLSALLAAGFQMLTITLSAENPAARCVLLHEGSWKAALAALETSAIEVLELNCQAASMVFRSTSLLHRFTELQQHVPLESAMRYVEEHFGDVWMIKSWNGNTAADGVQEGSRGYALMRRSVAEAAREALL